MLWNSIKNLDSTIKSEIERNNMAQETINRESKKLLDNFGVEADSKINEATGKFGEVLDALESRIEETASSAQSSKSMLTSLAQLVEDLVMKV